MEATAKKEKEFNVDLDTIIEAENGEVKKKLLDAIHIMIYATKFPEDVRYNKLRMEKFVSQFTK